MCETISIIKWNAKPSIKDSTTRNITWFWRWMKRINTELVIVGYHQAVVVQTL